MCFRKINYKEYGVILAALLNQDIELLNDEEITDEEFDSLCYIHTEATEKKREYDILIHENHISDPTIRDKAINWLESNDIIRCTGLSFLLNDYETKPGQYSISKEQEQKIIKKLSSSNILKDCYYEVMTSYLYNHEFRFGPDAGAPIERAIVQFQILNEEARKMIIEEEMRNIFKNIELM